MSFDDGAIPPPPTGDIEFSVDGSTFANIGVKVPNGNSITVDWGDGNTDTYTGTGSNQSLTHTYSAPGTYHAAITATGILSFIATTPFIANNSLVSIDKLPSTLQVLSISTQSTFTTLNYVALPNLQTFSISQCSTFNQLFDISSFTNVTLFYFQSNTAFDQVIDFLGLTSYSDATIDISPLTSCLTFGLNNNPQITNLDTSSLGVFTYFNAKDCSALATMDFTGMNNCINADLRNCALDSSMIDECLVKLDGFGNNNGTLKLEGQTPSAPPSGAGATAKANLIGKGWTVTTD
jgi:hypothetical protein